jgi:ABC-type nitrate/sulfonate/bicarbonate transport system ATPase subunit
MGNFAAKVSGLSVTRGGNQILSGLNFEIAPGELVALVGSSGAGKSTLLQALAGLIQPTSGQIEIQGAGKIDTAIAFQDSVLLPWLSVQENVEFGFEFAAISEAVSLSKAELREKSSALLERFGIGDLADRKVSELSGGQAQRVGIARAAIVDPNLLLLDEPFSAVDAVTRKSLQRWIKSIVSELSLTAVLVTHDIEEAVSIASRVLVLKSSGSELIEYHPDQFDSADLKQQITFQI